jgi:hypothetical protein
VDQSTPTAVPITEVSTAPAVAVVSDYRKPLRVWYSGRVSFPKFHLVAECEGLANVGDEWRETRRFASALAMLRSESGRPCRMCSFEPALAAAAAAPSLGRGRRVLTEFSGQPNPKEDSPFRYAWKEVSESGATRLRRLAETLDCAVVETVAGPVAYGHLPVVMAKVLSRNLRTIVCPTADHRPDRFEVEVRWSLLSDMPPERDVEVSLDAWTVARAIVAEPGHCSAEEQGERYDA